jgi:undecaprenyl-diphosphatase
VADPGIGAGDAALLGVVEGLTELLPVSSTGHLILLGSLLGHGDEAHKALDVVIQLGAVVALCVLFRTRLTDTAREGWRGDAAARKLIVAVLVAFLPAAIAGLLVGGWVKEHLFGPRPVAAALIAGGVIMLAVERLRARSAVAGVEALEQVTARQALVVGLCQCLALWPGASRSMTTILGGQLAGLGLRTSAEFSFLLAIPTLGAACVYDLAKNGARILAMPGGATALAVGLGLSFVVTWLVAAVFLRFVARIGLWPFALYRIALGALVLWLAS